MAEKTGFLSCTEGNRFNSVCTLRCSAGYELEGHSIISCLSDGKWNNSIGICKSK